MVSHRELINAHHLAVQWPLPRPDKPINLLCVFSSKYLPKSFENFCYFCFQKKLIPDCEKSPALDNVTECRDHIIFESDNVENAFLICTLKWLQDVVDNETSKWHDAGCSVSDGENCWSNCKGLHEKWCCIFQQP